MQIKTIRKTITEKMNEWLLTFFPLTALKGSGLDARTYWNSGAT